MSIIARFNPFEPTPNCASIEAFLADWDRRQRTETGSSYVYAFRDAAGSAFYIGKGLGKPVERHEIATPGDFSKLTDDELVAQLEATLMSLRAERRVEGEKKSLSPSALTTG